MTDLQTILARAKKNGTRPNASVFQALGQEVARQLPGLRSYAEIGQRIGTTPQLAQYHTLLALGKLTWYLRQSVGEKPIGE